MSLDQQQRRTVLPDTTQSGNQDSGGAT